MTREKRNILIEESTALLSSERRAMLMISGVIGDDNVIDIDWDDLMSSTGLRDLEAIEAILELTFDLGIIDELNYEEGFFG